MKMQEPFVCGVLFECSAQVPNPVFGREHEKEMVAVNEGRKKGIKI